VRRSSRSRLQRIADLVVSLGVGLFLMAMVAGGAARHAAPLTALGLVAGAAQGAALWWRRSHPLPVMAVALAGGLVVQLLVPEGLFPYAGLVALGSLAAARPPRVSLPALAALLGLTALNFLTAPGGDTLFAMAVAVVVWALGEAARNRRAAIDQAARRAASEEQARIARELHDVIAHTVSVIVVQAAAADDVFEQRPDQARAALRSIEAAGRDALGELRRLLAAVRPGADAGSSPPPEPGLDRLGELVAPLRAAGLEVTLRREGAAGALPAGIDRCAYRIVQEALTNTLRHAGAAHAAVTVRATPEALELDVLDDGRGGTPAAAGNGAGRGIAGMRERAATLGGSVQAGPLPDGGFRVHARLPLERSG
jgi:signal transduction histidine kinase